MVFQFHQYNLHHTHHNNIVPLTLTEPLWLLGETLQRIRTENLYWKKKKSHKIWTLKPTAEEKNIQESLEVMEGNHLELWGTGYKLPNIYRTIIAGTYKTTRSQSATSFPLRKGLWQNPKALEMSWVQLIIILGEILQFISVVVSGNSVFSVSVHMVLVVSRAININKWAAGNG